MDGEELQEGQPVDDEFVGADIEVDGISGLSAESSSSSDDDDDDDDETIKNEESKPASDLLCRHYERHCAFKTPCCQKIYVCRFCHNEKESHELDRHTVMEIQCLKCQTLQEVRRDCISCGQVFGKYFCDICRMYDDKDKQQFHCNACGICRIGGRENFFHCTKCDLCLPKNMEGSHKCVEKAAHSDCPVCLEFMHSSTSSVTPLNCGHMVHTKCHRDMMRKGLFTCPLCGKSTTDMTDFWQGLDVEIAATEMPEEYRGRKVWVLCRDCQLTSETAYHFIGLKCQGCGSYNTCCTAPKSTSAATANPGPEPTAAGATVSGPATAAAADDTNVLPAAAESAARTAGMDITLAAVDLEPTAAAAADIGYPAADTTDAAITAITVSSAGDSLAVSTAAYSSLAHSSNTSVSAGENDSRTSGVNNVASSHS